MSPSDDSKINSGHRDLNGRFKTFGVNDKQRSKSTLQKKSCNLSQKSKYKYPDLSVLKPLLTMTTIQSHSKLSLMIYDALKPYIEIFDNEYMSFIEICTKFKLVDFSVLDYS